MERETTRKQQALMTKRKIYRISIDLIKKRGYDHVSIDEICEICGITKGAFYHHFKSKEDLIIGICMDMDYSLQGYLEEILNKRNPMERLEGILLCYLRFTSEIGLDITRQLYKIMMEGKHNYIVSPDRYTSKELCQAITDGQRAGYIRSDISDGSMMKHLQNFIFGLSLDWCINDGNYDIQEAGHNSIREFLLYIESQQQTFQK